MVLAVVVVVGLAAITVQFKLAEPASGRRVLIDRLRRRAHRFRLAFRLHVEALLGGEREGEDHQGGDERRNELSHVCPSFSPVNRAILNIGATFSSCQRKKRRRFPESSPLLQAVPTSKKPCQRGDDSAC